MAEFKQTGPFSRQAAANVEALPGQFWGLLQGLGRKIGRAGQYLGSEKASQDYTNLLRGRPAVAAPTAQPGILNFPPGYKEAELAAGLAAERSRPGAGFPEQQGLVFGLDKNRNVDRRKSDLYKQYAQTPEGQFERYFKTQEMAPYFGTSFQGTGAPTSAQAMIDLASQVAAPTTAPLASFYAAQSATGRGSMDEIISAMGYKGTPMEQWAKSNPMLAFREYNKKFPAGAPTQGPTPALPGPPMGEGDTVGQRALEAAQYQLSGDEPASVRQRTDNFLAGVGNPVTPTEALNQGEAVDANRGAQYLREAQKMKTQGYQQFLPTSQPLF